MPITFPVTLPSEDDFIAVIDESWAAVATSKSNFSGSQQTQDFGGKLLIFNCRLKRGKEDDIEPWRAFFKQLNYGAGTFLMGDPARPTPRGNPVGTPLVNGASQPVNGQTLVTDGWTPSAVNVLRAHDYIQIGTGAAARLYVNMTDVDADGSGNATLDIWPGLRESPADNTPIITSNAQGVFKLMGRPQVSRALAGIYGEISFRAQEAI